MDLQEGEALQKKRIAGLSAFLQNAVKAEKQAKLLQMVCLVHTIQRNHSMGRYHYWILKSNK